MRRVVLLVLLALALPTVALATSIDYGGFADDTHPAALSGSVTAGGSFTLTFNELQINGSAAGPGSVTFAINLGSSCGTDCFNIASGTVTVKNGSSVTLFTGTFSNGNVLFNGSNVNISGFTSGGTSVAGVVKSSGTCDMGKGISCWTGSSNTSVVPEPGTLGLLGTGLVGLAGMVRRKLRG